MKNFTNEKLIAYLALFSGLSISAVAVYYSVIGLTAIFAAAAIPIIVMGIALEISKLIATVWLKQNWRIAPTSIKAYLMIAIVILMFITSIGIFGFLSKAHSDQTLISGDFQSKLAIYDEKIKTAKENIEADRRQLKQMDEAVDQVMARSTTEEGASRSNAIRKAQARDRSALAKSIEANQKLIAAINDEAAPIRAEIRKVEAEVGPLKYIAQFIYGETDKNLLEKAVTWVIIVIVLVFDPLAVILLLASQISFQHIKEKNELLIVKTQNVDTPVAEVKEETPSTENKELVINEETHPYLYKTPTLRHPPGVDPVEPQVYFPPIVESTEKAEPVQPDRQEIKQAQTVAAAPRPTRVVQENKFVRTKVFKRPEAPVQETVDESSNLQKSNTSTFDWSTVPSDSEYVTIDGQRMHFKVALEKFPPTIDRYVQNEEQTQSNLWSSTVENTSTQQKSS